jgi:predicted RNA-binding protein with TRAM domain
MEDDGQYVEKVAPVKVGSLVRLKMLGRGGRGDAFGRIEGFVIFVGHLDDSDMNQFIDVEVTEVKQRCAFGKKI